MGTVTAAVAGAVIGLILAAVTYRNYKLRRHAGMTEEEFVSHFLARGVPDPVSRAVHRHLRGVVRATGFQPAPSDEIEAIYGCDEDIENHATAILRELGYEMPHSGVRLRWATPVNSLEDLVWWVDWVRRGSPPL
jgi:hypothetical protein